MARLEFKSTFQENPCKITDSSTDIIIEEFSNWSIIPEHELLKQFSNKGFETIILLRIEELTPNFYFTFSLPFLWGGTNEVDFRIRVLSTKSGNVINDMRVRRATGGPFNIRPASWSSKELREALLTLLNQQGKHAT